MRRLVSELPGQGVTVLYSSHLLAEVEDVCNRVAILNAGRVAFEGGLDELRASFGETTRIVTPDVARTAEIAAAIGITTAKVEGDAVWIDATTRRVDALTLALGSAGIPIRTLSHERRSLEDLFFQ